jgi:hypothetical protein
MKMIDPVTRKHKIINSIKNGVNAIRNNKTIDVDEELQDYKDSIINVCQHLCKDDNFFCERIANTNNIVLRSIDGCVGKSYNVISTDTVTFSGTIGVKEVEYDAGVEKHLSYFRLFTDQQSEPLLKNKLRSLFKQMNVINEKSIINLYKNFYDNLKEYFETYPLAMYSLMTGIKKVYALPSNGIIITPRGYSFINFDNFKSIDLINRSSNFSYETSNKVPCLKIYYQGHKLMHLRTKIDYKNEKFRLRFFIETGKNFFKIFEEFTGDIKNEF